MTFENKLSIHAQCLSLLPRRCYTLVETRTFLLLTALTYFLEARHGHWLSPSYHPLASLSISLSTWPVHISQYALSLSLPLLPPPPPPPPILSFLSGYPVIAEAQCDPGLNTHPTQTLHPHTCPPGFMKGKKLPLTRSWLHKRLK